jgi:hypothetical protein
MALTITQYPLSKTPAYNDQWFIGSSNQTAISDFYYKIDFTCNSVTLTEKVLPDLNGRFVYNAKEKAKNFIEHYFNPNDTGLVEAINKAVSVTLTVTEYYSGALQTAGAYTMSYVAFDACLNEEDFESYVPNTYCTNLLGSPKALNVADSVVTPLTDIWVHFFAQTNWSSVAVSFFDEFGSIESYSFPIPSTTNNKIYSMNIGYKGILANLSYQLTAGMSVSFIIYDSSNSAVANYIYYVTDVCSRYDVTRLYYLSRSGRILYKQFSLAATKRMSKKTSNVRLGKGNVVSGIMTTNRWDREVHEVANVTTYTSTLTSDWISEAQNEALQELFDSPIVWQHDGTNYIPVTITDTSYDFKKHNSDKLFNYTVNIEYNTQETRQRGL